MAERKLRVVGQDPSLRNWGLAIGNYDMDTKRLTIEDLSLTNPVLTTSKQVRQNSLDLESGVQLYAAAVRAAKDAHAVFIEVPVGSQSARAMASYGICVGVLGALKAIGTPFFELSPTEVKLAGAGKKTATKREMIEWAMATHPEANWPMYQQHGISKVSEAQAEHLADAVAAIHAGIASTSFQQLVALWATPT